MFDLDMNLVRLEHLIGAGGERLIELVLKPHDRTNSILMTVRAPDTQEFRECAKHPSFRISAIAVPGDRDPTTSGLPQAALG